MLDRGATAWGGYSDNLSGDDPCSGANHFSGGGLSDARHLGGSNHLSGDAVSGVILLSGENHADSGRLYFSSATRPPQACSVDGLGSNLLSSDNRLNGNRLSGANHSSGNILASDNHLSGNRPSGANCFSDVENLLSILCATWFKAEERPHNIFAYDSVWLLLFLLP